MQPWEFWQLYEAHRERKNYGGMTEAEVEEIYEEAYGDGD